MFRKDFTHTHTSCVYDKLGKHLKSEQKFIFYGFFDSIRLMFILKM